MIGQLGWSRSYDSGSPTRSWVSQLCILALTGRMEAASTESKARIGNVSYVTGRYI